MTHNNVRHNDTRPNTATAKAGQRSNPIVLPPERPMSARIAGDINNIGSTKAFIPKRKGICYIATHYMRPFTSHRRPISAAVNPHAGTTHTEKKINPAKTRTQYAKYLKQLASETEGLAVEDDVILEKVQKNKSLLGRIKKGQKVRKVKLKKNGSGVKLSHTAMLTRKEIIV